MEYWDKLKSVPAEALKEIGAGRLKGKLDINPQWRYKKMTEVFGPCGEGWKYEIAKMWTEQASDGQVFAFVNINLYVHYSDKWSDPIPGTGGSMLIANETKGAYSNDEAFKMATTDALSVALKMVGVASEVYEGVYDTKYSTSGATAKRKSSSLGIPCPKCGNMDAVIVGKKEYGGGLLCFAKKGGCGHKFKSLEMMTQELKDMCGDDETWGRFKNWVAAEFPNQKMSEVVQERHKDLLEICEKNLFEGNGIFN